MVQLFIRKPEKLKLIVKVIYDVFLVALIPLITIMYNEISKDKKMLNDINNILIGESADYCDDCFGVPVFQEQNENGIDERVYNNKYVIIRAYFKNSSLIGYFVTAKKDNGKVRLPEQFSHLVDERPLGEFTFKDIDNTPVSVQLYNSNGVAHSFYSENYYFATSGNYYYFYFMDLDYGFYYNMVYDSDAFESDIELEDVYLDYYPGDPLIDRSKSFPNTYGMAKSDLNEIYELISTYHNYNFQGLD